MRSLVRLAVLAPAALVAVFAACGGSTVKAPDPQPSASSAPTPSAEPTSPGSTTTRVEEDAGLGQKLDPKSDGRSAEESREGDLFEVVRRVVPDRQRGDALP